MSKRLRLSSTLVFFWERIAGEKRLVCRDFLTRKQASFGPEVVAILHEFRRPRAPGAVVRKLAGSHSPAALKAAIRNLERLDFLKAGANAKERLMDQWHWGFAARHYLFSTRSAHKAVPEKERLKAIEKLHESGPPPRRYKTFRGARKIRLGRPRSFSGPVAEGIAGLKNTRSFVRKPIELKDLREILYLSWGSRGELETEHWGKLLDKPLYSGGNRYPVEVYVVATDVRGLKQGLYHFDVKSNALALLKRGRFERTARRIGNEQDWIRGASAYFLMTAVWGRTMWKYRNDIGLAMAHFDVGHHSQTLYLCAESLGLGACTTYALDHKRADRFIGLDGVKESFLCLSMVGHTDPAVVA